MKLAHKVAWSEGLLLLPQHFQQADRYHESLLSSRFSAMDPQAFGVVAVAFDAHRLTQQQELSLVHFEGIMPDGLPLSLGDNQGEGPAARAITDHFPPAMEALEVYLSVPVERPGINNYATDGERLRYRIGARRLADAAADDRADDVGVVSPNPLLLFGDEVRDDSASIKIAEVVREGREGLTLSRTYIPPCLRVNASPVLIGHFTRLLSLMVMRHRSLSSARRVVGDSRVEFNAADVTRYLQLNALNTMLPSIQYLADVGDVPPRTAYFMLTQLAGALAVFSADVDMTVPRPFDYADLRTTFGRLFELAEALLKATDVETHVACTLQLHENSRFFGDLTDERLARCRRFFLAVESPLPRARLVQEMVQNAKVASHDDLEIVLASNVGGVDVRENPQPPPQLPLRPGLVYFDVPIRVDDVYWKHVVQDRNIVVWLPPAIDSKSASIKLVGVFASR